MLLTADVDGIENVFVYCVFHILLAVQGQRNQFVTALFQILVIWLKYV